MIPSVLSPCLSMPIRFLSRHHHRLTAPESRPQTTGAMRVQPDQQKTGITPNGPERVGTGVRSRWCAGLRKIPLASAHPYMRALASKFPSASFQVSKFPSASFQVSKLMRSSSRRAGERCLPRGTSVAGSGRERRRQPGCRTRRPHQLRHLHVSLLLDAGQTHHRDRRSGRSRQPRRHRHRLRPLARLGAIGVPPMPIPSFTDTTRQRQVESSTGNETGETAS